MFNQERLSVTFSSTVGFFLEPKAAMATGLHNRLKQKPERHQEMVQLASFWLSPVSRECLLLSSLSHQLDPLCIWVKISLTHTN